MRINNDFIIVGVDAGYGNMKTANTIFPTGLAAMDTKPYFDGDIMHYNGRWYRIGEGHKAFNPDKTASSRWLLLPLNFGQRISRKRTSISPSGFRRRGPSASAMRTANT